jgi:hypothetical protein
MIISECRTHLVRLGGAGDRIGKEERKAVHTYAKIMAFSAVVPVSPPASICG